jgi:hypothetical protein
MKVRKTWAIVGAFCLSLGSLGSSVSAEPQSSPNAVEVFKASDIRLYKTLPDVPKKEKEKAVVEHKEAIELINQHIRENNIKIDVDLDNPKYQQYVLSLGTAFDLFSAEDEKNCFVRQVYGFV